MKRIGEKFTHKGVKLITLEDLSGCDGCYFYDYGINGCGNKRFHCTVEERSDGRSVMFKNISFKFGR